MSLEGKVALVTGASRGIGKAIAQSLAGHGAHVIGTATSEQGAEKISQYFQENNLEGSGKVLNVADAEQVKAFVAELTQHKGAPSILINNAGITRDNIMLRMKDEEWLDVISTNLNGTFYVTKACLRGMIKARWGRIVNISSVVGSNGNPGQANYAASKGGIDAFTKSLAKEIATRNVTVNSVAPGFINTDMTNALDEKQQAAIMGMIPANRIGEVREIAETVVFLASEAASYITGQVLHVNGGMF